MSNESCMISINLPPALEDAFVDWLLATNPDQGFTSYRVDGHGSDHGLLSVAEQVRGRQRRMEFRVVLETAGLEAFVAALHTAFAGADLFFYVLPVLRSGHLGDQRVAQA